MNVFVVSIQRFRGSFFLFLLDDSEGKYVYIAGVCILQKGKCVCIFKDYWLE